MLGDLPSQITDMAQDALKNIPEEEIEKMSYQEVSKLVVQGMNKKIPQLDTPPTQESGKPIPLDISKIFTALMEGAETIMTNENLGILIFLLSELIYFKKISIKIVK